MYRIDWWSLGRKLFAELRPSSKRSNDQEDDTEVSEGDIDSEEELEKSVPAKVKTSLEGIESLEEVLTFIRDKGHTDEANSVSSLISFVIKKSYIASALAKQSLFTEYLRCIH